MATTGLSRTMTTQIDWKKYPNFSGSEFTCTHCGQEGIKPELLERLQVIRTKYGRAMPISSGYRCPRHPIEAAKSAPGAHSTGLACDIAVSGDDAYEVLKLALEHGFTGIGVQQKGSGRFIHLDMVKGDNRPAVWSY